MSFPASFLDELIARSDIVDVVSDYVHLTKKGSNLFGLCPFHSEKTGSFSVAPDKQIYHCFGCGKGGGVINFIMEEENLSFPDAVRFLAKRANMEVPEDRGDHESGQLRQRVLNLNRDAARFYHRMLNGPEGRAVQAYLNRRQIDRRTAVRFGMGASLDQWDALIKAMGQLGYTKAELLAAGLAVQNKNGGIYDKFRNRLMLPVIDVRGDVIGFGSRVLDKSEPKYMNTSETITYSKRRALYAMNLAKKSKRPNIILCEGNLDVVTLHQAGFDNAVASMGTALTQEQIRLLSRYTKEIIICYDNDNAGKLATERALQLLRNSEFTVRVLQLPNRIIDGKSCKQDADDFIKTQGREAFERLLTGSENGVEYRMAVIRQKYTLDSDAQKVEYSKEISEMLATLDNSVEREVYANRAAEICGISAQAILSEAKRAYFSRQKRAKAKQLRKDLNPAMELQPKERTTRYDNIHSARAEEGIIRILVLDSSLFLPTPPIAAQAFSSPLLAKVYSTLWDAAANGRTSGISVLAPILTGEEMNHITTILQQPESPAGREQALQDYITIVNNEAAKRMHEASIDPLAAAMEKNKDKKQYGGKLNG